MGILAEFKVILSNNAEKGLRNAQSKPRERLKEALDILKTNPVPTQLFDVTKISGSSSNYRIRIGRYRILYVVLWLDKIVKVFDIDKRDDSTYR